MSNEINRNVTSYVTVKLGIAGKEFDFTDKSGKQVKGVTKETIKIKTPYGGLNLRPKEMLAIILLHKDTEFMAELNQRAKAEGN